MLILGYIYDADLHGEQLRNISIAMHFYTVQSVARDRLQMFDDLVALVYEQTQSSDHLVMRRSLSIKILDRKQVWRTLESRNFAWYDLSNEKISISICSFVCLILIT